MSKDRKIEKFVLLIAIMICSTLWWTHVSAEARVSFSKGQTVYVPAYSHIYSGNREHPFYLAVTLSIRNTDATHSITISTADYFDSKGKLLLKHIKQPITLEAMASTRFVVPESHKAGGSGAYFIVEWESGTNVTPPVVESIMIGTQTQQGISFTSRGQVTEEKSK